MKILYTRPDGGISLVNSKTIDEVNKMLCMTELHRDDEGVESRIQRPLNHEEYRKHVWEVSVPKDAINAFEVADDFEFPHPEYRDALVMRDGKVDLDAEKVALIDKMREQSAKIMANLGIEG